MRLALPLLALLTLAACDSDRADRLDVSTLSQDPAALVGTWDLAFSTSSGEFGPPSRTPVSVLGYTSTYVFGADGQAEVYSDGERLLTGTYEVRPYRYTDGRPPTSVRYLRITYPIDGTGDYGTNDYLFGTDGDRLYFDARPMDGDLREYHRR